MAALVPTLEELEANYAEYERELTVSEVTERRYDELLDSMEDFRELNRLLDFGCGSGDFLLAARRHGWDVEGVEFDQEAIRVCADRGLPIRPDVEGFEARTFDVVTGIEVVEHLNDPAATLRQFSRVLRQGGMAYLTTPNFGSLSRRLLGPRWRIVSYPEHLQYFTRASLSDAAQRAGFQVLEMTSTGISPRDIVNGFSSGRIAAEGQGGGLDEALRQRAERRRLAGSLKRVINRSLALTGLGDTLKARLVTADR